MIKKSHVLSLLLTSLFATINAQDAKFLNNQQSLVHLNPSFAGSNGGVRVQSIHSAQPNYGNYSSYYSGADVYLKKIKGGLAITYLHEDWNRGMFNTSNLSLSYAQYFSVAENKIRIIPSLQLEVIQNKFDPEKMSFSHALNLSGGLPSHGFGAARQKHNLGFSSGLLVNYKRFYFGASVFHINQPNIGLLGDNYLPARFNLYSSANFDLITWLKTNVSVRYDYQAASAIASLNMNNLIVKHILLNVGINTRSFANVGLGYRANFFSISAGYGWYYDPGPFEQSKIMELSLSLNVRAKEHRKSLTDFEKQ